MRKLKYEFSRLALNQIYISYVRPIIEYSSIVWDGCSEQNADLLEKLQHEAARIVTGLTRSVSLENLYKDCGWPSLAISRKYQKLNFMYKALNNMVPGYISYIIPPFVRDQTNYPLRNRNDLTVPINRTEIFRKSCIPSSTNLWNSLDNTLKEIPSFEGLKILKDIYLNATKVLSYFTYGNRILAIWHLRLRNQCSSLNYFLDITM